MSQTHPRPMVPSFKPPSLSHCPGQAELEQISMTGEWLICRHTQSYLLKGIKANALGNGKNKEQEIWKKGKTIQVSWILQSLCAWPCYHRLRRLSWRGVGGLKAEMRMSCLIGESRGTPQPRESVFRLKEEICGGQSLYG